MWPTHTHFQEFGEAKQNRAPFGDTDPAVVSFEAGLGRVNPLV